MIGIGEYYTMGPRPLGDGATPSPHVPMYTALAAGLFVGTGIGAAAAKKRGIGALIGGAIGAGLVFGGQYTGLYSLEAGWWPPATPPVTAMPVSTATATLITM